MFLGKELEQNYSSNCVILCGALCAQWQHNFYGSCMNDAFDMTSIYVIHINTCISLHLYSFASLSQGKKCWQQSDLLNFVVNSSECLMTRMQEMSMDYHFKVEQESGSTMCSFFGFNGKQASI